MKAGASRESRDAAHAGDADARAAADEAVSGGKMIFGGFGIGFIYYGLQQIFKVLKDMPEKIFGAAVQGASISLEINPALLGVGYIIGPRIASLMCAAASCLSRSDPGDQIFRRRRNAAARAGNCHTH